MDTLTHNDALTPSSLLHDTPGSDTPAHDLYEVDFYQWAFHNADLLRQGRFTEIDLENIVEELESMARNN
ncbi:protein containing DUF29, partial [Candidatus Magnetobacterium bavaricum]